MSEEIKETIVNEAAEAAAEVAAEAAPAVEEAAPAAEEAAPAAEEAKEAVPSMDDFADAVDKSMRKIEKGDLVEGVVTGVSDSEITVDLQYYAEGVIRPLDYSGDPNFSLNDVHVGDEVKAIVLRTDDGRGNIQLSRRAAMEKIAWDDLKSMMDNKDDTEIKITATTKGGVVGFLKGIRAFIPASQLALSYVENLDDFIGKVVPARVITATEEGKKLVLSCRDILKERRDAEKAERISNIQPGLVTEGKVQSLQSYGAFVSLGDGVDGLVHISQISSGGKRLKHAKEALEVGQTVKVKVIKVENGRISLSMRALEEAPAKPVEEEKVVLPKSEKLTTSLGSLLGNIKLD